jgi:preprotein translocase subunit SecY
VQGQRKIPVQYAKRVVGNKVMGGQSSFLPLKVNYSGVMPGHLRERDPAVPAADLLVGRGPSDICKFLDEISPTTSLRGTLDVLHVLYTIADPLLQLFLGVGHVQADPDRRRPEEIRRLRPRRRARGEPTAQFLDFIMTRLTLAGAMFLTVIAVMPDAAALRAQRAAAASRYFFGGTGMLITVGVILDTMRQIETFLLQRHYDGFLKKGRIRAAAAQTSRGEPWRGDVGHEITGGRVACPW